jgi:hypothetical protein
VISLQDDRREWSVSLLREGAIGGDEGCGHYQELWNEETMLHGLPHGIKV